VDRDAFSNGLASMHDAGDAHFEAIGSLQGGDDRHTLPSLCQGQQRVRCAALEQNFRMDFGQAASRVEQAADGIAGRQQERVGGKPLDRYDTGLAQFGGCGTDSQHMFESLTSIAPHARQKAIRALGVTGPKRSAGFPELPTIAPRPIVDKLNAAINRAIRSDFFKARCEQIGDEPAGGTPEEFAALIKKESAKWADVVKRSGAKLE
jgi:hypothetical protein